jgi:Rrf2 family protein
MSFRGSLVPMYTGSLGPVGADVEGRWNVTVVSRGADYAIRAMLDVASKPVDTRAVTERIAERQEIPVAFLSKVVGQLTQSGLLRTYRGASGGVFLAKPADDINLRQILEAVQGPIVLNQCTAPYNGCPRAATCPVVQIFLQAQEGLEDILEQANLAELAREAEILAGAQDRGGNH